MVSPAATAARTGRTILRRTGPCGPPPGAAASPRQRDGDDEGDDGVRRWRRRGCRPCCAPIHRAGSRAASQARFSQMVTLVLPSPVWMSKTSAVTMRATITKARNAQGLGRLHPVARRRGTSISAGESVDQHRGDGGHERTSSGRARWTPSGEGVRLALGETGEGRDRHVPDGGADQAGDPAGDVVGQEVEAQHVGPEHVAHDDRVGEQHDGLETQADRQRDAERRAAAGRRPGRSRAGRADAPIHRTRTATTTRLGERTDDEAVGAGAFDCEGEADDRRWRRSRPRSPSSACPAGSGAGASPPRRR